MAEEPSEDYLRSLINDIPPLWAGRNERIWDVRDARKHITATTVPSEIAKLTKLPDPQDHSVEDLIRHTQGLFASKLPVCTREPFDPLNATDVANAELVAKWVNASWVRTLGPPGNVYYKLTDAFPQDGQAVIQDIPKLHQWHPTKRKGEDDTAYLKRLERVRRDYFPWFTGHIDTTMYFPVSYNDEDSLDECLIIEERERAPTLRQFEKDINTAKVGMVVDSRLGSSGGPTCQFATYWSSTHFAYLIDQILVKVGTHKIGRPPIYDPDFSTTSLKDRKYLTEGLADPLVSIQRQIEAIDLLFQAWAHFSALPRFRWRPLNADDLQPIPADYQISIGPLEFIAGPPGWFAEQIDLQDIGETLMRWRSAVMQKADDLALAPILLGKLEHTQAGPTTSAMLDVAKSVLGVAHGNLRGCFNEIARTRLRYIDKVIKTPVPIEYYDPEDREKKHGQWLEIGPKEIQSSYRVDHEVQPITAAERAIELQIAERLHQNRQVDKRYVLQKAGIPQPEEMLERVRLEDLEAAGPVQQKVITEAFRLFDAFIGQQTGQLAGEGTPEAPPAGMDGPFVPQIGGGGTNPGIMELERPLSTIGENPAMPAGAGPPMPPNGMP